MSGVYETDINWSKEGNLSLVFGAYAKLGVWHDWVKARPAKAYLIHDDCWTVLAQQFLGESQIDLGRVFDICKDIPSALRNTERQLGESPLFVAFGCVNVHTYSSAFLPAVWTNIRYSQGLEFGLRYK